MSGKLFLLSLVVLHLSQSQPVTLGTSGGNYQGASFDFDSTSTLQSCLQTCPTFYRRTDGKRNGYFSFGIERVTELNATGEICCETCNPVQGECFRHTVLMKNVFNSTVVTPSKEARYAGYLSSVSTATAQCDPGVALSYFQVCASVEITYTIYDDETIVVIGGAPFRAREWSLLGKMKVTNWNFTPGSTGLRFYLALSALGVNVRSFVVNPGNQVDPTTVGIDTLTVTTVRGNQASGAYGSIGIVDGVPVNATVSGISPITAREARYVYVDVKAPTAPTTSTTIETHFNVYFPSFSSNTEDIVDGMGSHLKASFLFALLALYSLVH